MKRTHGLCGTLLVCLVVVLLSAGVSNANGLTQEVAPGVRLTYQNLKIVKDKVMAVYSIVSAKDIEIKITNNKSSLFDSNGMELNNRGLTPYIGGTQTWSREIVGGVATEIIIRYVTPEKYKPTKMYPKITIMINDKGIVFRDAPSGL